MPFTKKRCVSRESNPDQLLGRQLCWPLYHWRLMKTSTINLKYNYALFILESCFERKAIVNKTFSPFSRERGRYISVLLVNVALKRLASGKKFKLCNNKSYTAAHWHSSTVGWNHFWISIHYSVFICKGMPLNKEFQRIAIGGNM